MRDKDVMSIDMLKQTRPSGLAMPQASPESVEICPAVETFESTLLAQRCSRCRSLTMLSVTRPFHPTYRRMSRVGRGQKYNIDDESPGTPVDEEEEEVVDDVGSLRQKNETFSL